MCEKILAHYAYYFAIAEKNEYRRSLAKLKCMIFPFESSDLRTKRISILLSFISMQLKMISWIKQIHVRHRWAKEETLRVSHSKAHNAACILCGKLLGNFPHSRCVSAKHFSWVTLEIAAVKINLLSEIRVGMKSLTSQPLEKTWCMNVKQTCRTSHIRG